MTILELREKRAKAWEAAKAFLDSHRNDKGILSAEDDATYTRMEQDITDLGKEIARLERQEALDAELSKPTAALLTGKPLDRKADERTGRATDEYRSGFWNLMRSKNPMPQVVDALRIGADTEGGYLVPDEYERTLVEALEEENIFRSLAHIIRTASGERKIPVVSSKGTASWIEEGGAFPESNDTFGQVTIGAYKLGTTIKISEELLNDSVFDLENYNALMERYDAAKARHGEVVDAIAAKVAQSERLLNFIKAMQVQEGILTEFDERLWSSMVDFVMVGRKKEITITFRDGTEITA